MLTNRQNKTKILSEKKMYFAFVIFCVLCVIVANLIIDFSFLTATNLLISFAMVLLPSLFVAIVIRLLPKSWFDFNNRIYFVSEKEKNFLVKIGIRKWKDKIPDLGNTVKFKKSKLVDSKNTDYLKKFITETCYGEILHIFCILSALLSLFFVPRAFVFKMALPIALIYSFLNIPSILIQRYNRPRLVKQLARLERNDCLSSEAEQNSENVKQKI